MSPATELRTHPKRVPCRHQRGANRPSPASAAGGHLPTPASGHSRPDRCTVGPLVVGAPVDRRAPTPCTHAPRRVVPAPWPRRRAPKRHSARLASIGSSGAIFQLIGAAAPCPIPAKRDIGVGSVAPRAARVFDTADGVQPLGQACGRWCTPWLPVRCLACGKCAPPPLGCGEDKNLQRPSPSRSHPLT